MCIRDRGYTADNAPDETSYLTNWHRFDEREGTLVRSVSMVMDYTDGYSFLVPDMWRGKVSTRMDAATRTLTFYEWVVADETTGSGAMGAALLRLQVFTKDKDVYKRQFLNRAIPSCSRPVVPGREKP